MEKIQNIRRGLQTGQVHGVDQDVDASSVTTPLERFTRASDDEVKTLILNSPDKSCDLDPMPTWLLKLCVDELLPVITAIVNASMDSSCVPRAFNCAQIRPLLQKPTLDPDILKHYRPVSNLLFIVNVLEKVVYTWIGRHLVSNGLYEELQPIVDLNRPRRRSSKRYHRVSG